MDTVIHFVLILLGVMILSASIYTPQCLSSATRHETDQAHAKRKALDIRLLSAFNLSDMSLTETLLWLFLMPTRIALHLL